MRFEAHFLLLIVLSCQGWGSTYEEDRAKVDQDVQLEMLVQACQRQSTHDQMCSMIVQLKQVGTDAVEAIKEFVPLGPYEYAILTLGNYAITGRIRVKLRPLIRPSISNTLDYTRDGTATLYFQYSF